jgi:hypothetical protein
MPDQVAGMTEDGADVAAVRAAFGVIQAMADGVAVAARSTGAFAVPAAERPSKIIVLGFRQGGTPPRFHGLIDRRAGIQIHLAKV